MTKQPARPNSLPPTDLSSGLDVTREQVSNMYMAGTSDGSLFEEEDRAGQDATRDDARPET